MFKIRIPSKRRFGMGSAVAAGGIVLLIVAGCTDGITFRLGK
jgi:hypothetical protein